MGFRLSIMILSMFLLVLSKRLSKAFSLLLMIGSFIHEFIGLWLYSYMELVEEIFE